MSSYIQTPERVAALAFASMRLPHEFTVHLYRHIDPARKGTFTFVGYEQGISKTIDDYTRLCPNARDAVLMRCR